MTPAVEQLVRETIDLTGAEEPDLLADDAPVLAEDALVLPPWEGDDKEDGFYLVGIIGGKDVGKSALVNALAGRKITEITSHGPGTETAVAYAHASREPALRKLLEREVPLYRTRLTVAPGLTGWAQVNTEYGDSVEDAIIKLEYDLYYVRHRSLWFDLNILAWTVGRMLGWKGR